jgi:hypothetical protein
VRLKKRLKRKTRLIFSVLGRPFLFAGARTDSAYSILKTPNRKNFEPFLRLFCADKAET